MTGDSNEILRLITGDAAGRSRLGASLVDGPTFESIFDQNCPVVRNDGSLSWGYFVLSGNTADGETLKIGDIVYEFDADASVVPGNVAVDISGGAGAAASIIALEPIVNNWNLPAPGGTSHVKAVIVDSTVLCLVGSSSAGVLVPGGVFNFGTTCVNATLLGFTLPGPVNGCTHQSEWEITPTTEFRLAQEHTFTVDEVSILGAGGQVMVSGSAYPDPIRLGALTLRSSVGTIKTTVGLVITIQSGGGGGSGPWYLLVEDPGGTRIANNDILFVEVTAVGS